MEEAFRAALNDLAERQETPSLDGRSLQLVVNATASEQEALKIPTGVPFAKLVYAARKLGRNWCAYTNPWGETPDRLARLQDDWAILAASLVRFPIQERVTLLRAFVESLDLGHLASSARKSGYLDRRRATCPEQFSGIDEIPGVRFTSQTAFVVHALEELADCPTTERLRLHAKLAEAAPAEGGGSPEWLFAELGAWISAQHQQES
jgi:hypothetical protein